jgi:5'-3' exonuclease
MGIKGFSKFAKPKEIVLKDLKGDVGIIDASVILYQAALGAKSTHTLTDSSGNPTIHINVILAKALNFKKNNIGQVWVFDYREKGYEPPNKKLELDKRRKKRETAKKSLVDLKQQNDDLFSSDEDDDIVENIEKKEKSCFTMSDIITNDCKFILDQFDIAWIIAPKGIEAEHYCAALTKNKIGDFVFSTDTDALMYGAKKLVRNVRIKKKNIFQEYVFADILHENDVTINDFRKIGVILGCDHAPKTPRVGPKTVLKKYKSIKLTDEQKEAIKIFEKKVKITSIPRSDVKSVAANKTKVSVLLDWLVAKNFNRNRVQKQINKAL